MDDERRVGLAATESHSSYSTQTQGGLHCVYGSVAPLSCSRCARFQRIQGWVIVEGASSATHAGSSFFVTRGNEIFFVPPERVRFHLAPLPAPRDRRGKHSDLRGEFEHGGAFRAKMSKHIFHVNVLAFTVAICQLEIPELQPVQFMVVTGSPGTKNTCEMDPRPPERSSCFTLAFVECAPVLWIAPDDPQAMGQCDQDSVQVLCVMVSAGPWWCRRVLLGGLNKWDITGPRV